jgi:hypothetical protein
VTVALKIGCECTDRASSGASGTTIVDWKYVATDEGTISQVDIWAVTNISDSDVAIFEFSGSGLSTVDSEHIGSITAGSEQNFTGLDLTVQKGSYLGIYYTGGTIEKSTSGETGFWYLYSDQIPCTDVSFSAIGGYGISLYGTGTGTNDAAIGHGAFDMDSDWAAGWTLVDKRDPATENCNIDNLKIFANSNLSDCEIASFADEGGNTLSTNDSEAIGSVTAGSVQTFSGLDMDFLTGEYSGYYASSGTIEKNNTGGVGLWYAHADYIPASSDSFSAIANYTIALWVYKSPSAGGQTIEPSAIASAEAIGSPQANFELALSAIASAEALGSPQLDFILAISGISSEEAFGSHQLNLSLNISAITSAEAIGDLVVSQLGFLSPDAIDSAETFGTAQLNFLLSMIAIASEEAFGTPKIIIYLKPDGVATAEAMSSPQLNLIIEPSGIATAESLGTASLKFYLLPGGIESAEAMGEPALLLKIASSGISSGENFGSASLKLYLLPDGIESAEAMGSHSINFIIELYPNGIESEEAFGSPIVSVPLILIPDGIASAEALGSLSLLIQYVIAVAVYWYAKSITSGWPDRDLKTYWPLRSFNSGWPDRDIEIRWPDKNIEAGFKDVG